jgi:peptidyl-prolyl cis-trans isomerase A (cyclophilin A)
VAQTVTQPSSDPRVSVLDPDPVVVEPKAAAETQPSPEAVGRLTERGLVMPTPEAMTGLTERGLVRPSGDPLEGKWTLADALRTLPGSGALVASFDTNFGKFECKLLSDKAPVTVANFIGLAQGTRPWRNADGMWVRTPAYDNTTFHRVIAGFMIQGGDAKGNGTGEPGYVIPDEIWKGAKHDRRGLLCMANRGPNTNGAQFFITDAAAPHLDSSYTIFGTCEPSVPHTIAKTPTQGDRPVRPVVINSVRILRR